MSTTSREDVDRMARLLMAEWERVECKPVNVSYVATFVDLARVVLADEASRVDDLVLKARAEGVIMASRRIGEDLRDFGSGLIEGADEGQAEILEAGDQTVLHDLDDVAAEFGVDLGDEPTEPNPKG